MAFIVLADHKPFPPLLNRTNAAAPQLATRTSTWLNPMMSQTRCPFCNLEQSRIRLENEFGVSLPDAFPVAVGHTLVIPKRHVASLFDLPAEEQAAIWRLVAQVRDKLVSELHPDGFNVGVNDGSAAGQTVMHAHVHVIPRWKDDVADPRGGVRWIMPDKAPYWAEGQK